MVAGAGAARAVYIACLVIAFVDGFHHSTRQGASHKLTRAVSLFSSLKGDDSFDDSTFLRLARIPAGTPGEPDVLELQARTRAAMATSSAAMAPCQNGFRSMRRPTRIPA